MDSAIAVERETFILPAPTLSGKTVMQSTSEQGGGRITVVDLQPRVRAEFGNLDGYTDPTGHVSPAEFGIRSMDAAGNLLFDSSGLVGLGEVLAIDSITSTVDTTGFGSNNWQTVAGSGTSFTVNRPLKVLVFAHAGGVVTGAAAYGGYWVNLQGSGGFVLPAGNPLKVGVLNWQVQVSVSRAIIYSLPAADTYTVHQQVETAVGSAVEIVAGALSPAEVVVLQLGG